MKKRKTFASLAAAVFLLSLMLGGCSFAPQSIESLMRPPYLSNEKELEKSLNSLLGKEISFRSPETGDFHSAITIRDLDGDDQTEAVVFYVKNNDASSVRMSVLKRVESGWSISSDFAGNGIGVYSISFNDLNNDGSDEMLVSWYLYDNKTAKTLTVYKCKNEEGQLGVSACATESYNMMCVEDMFGTGEKQLLLAYSDSSKTPLKTSLRMIGLNDENEISLLSETKLDSRITGLVSVSSDRTAENKNPRIFIDARVPDNQMITEVLIWNETGKSFNQIFTNAILQTNTLTQRSDNLLSTDIDGDGQIEIPLRKSLAEAADGDTSIGYLLEWCAVTGGGLQPKTSYAVNQAEGYMLLYPAEWKNKIYVNSDNASRRWNFITDDGTKLFDITVFSLDGWDENSAAVTEVLHIQNDLVYACTVTADGTKFGIKAVDLLGYFEMDT